MDRTKEWIFFCSITVYLLFYLLGLACVCLLLLKQQDFLPDGKLIPSIGYAYNAIQLSKDCVRS